MMYIVININYLSLAPVVSMSTTSIFLLDAAKESFVVSAPPVFNMFVGL